MRPFRICRQCLVRSSARPSLANILVRSQDGNHAYSHSVIPEALPTASSLSPYPTSSPQNAAQASPILEHSAEVAGTSHDETNHGGSKGADLDIALSCQEKNSEISSDAVPWDGQLKKFDPMVASRKTRSKALLTPRRSVENARDLKAKIFTAQCHYETVRWDIKAFYRLSHAEMHQTVSQLRRLLWGQPKEETTKRLDHFHLWKSEFAYRMAAVRTAGPPTTISIEPRIEEMLNCAQNDPSTFEAIWHRLSLAQRQIQWPQVVVAAIWTRPSVLLPLICMTFDQAYCANYVLEDVVYFLGQIRKSTSLPNAKLPKAGDSIKMADFLIRHATFRYVHLYQSTLRHVCTRVSLDKLWEFYQISMEKEQYWAPNTLLHLADRFARVATHKEHAMQILTHSAQLPGFNINSPESASVCTTLLSIQKDSPLPEGQAEPDLLFKFLLELGLTPNLINWTALMRNFCIRGHLDTAWKVLDQLLQQGLQPDSVVLSTLMNRSRVDEDVASARNVMRLAIASRSWSASLMNDFLATIYSSNAKQQTVHRRQRKSNNSWRPMLQLYSRIFDLKPLQELTLFPLENLIASRVSPQGCSTELTELATAIPPLKSTELIKPTSSTLVLMFAAHMRSIQNPIALRRYYRLFQRLQEQNHPMVENMLRDHGTRMHDIFLQCFMQFRSSVPWALKVLLGMMRRGSQRLQDGRRKWKYQGPSVHSWTIIIHGLKNHQRSTDAIRVLDLMTRVGGVQPNSATWNSVIGALATQGRLREIVKIISYMEAAGQHSGEKTMDALKLLSQRQSTRLLELLSREREQAAATAGVRNFDNVQSRVASSSGHPQTQDINELLKLALPTRDFAEITGSSRRTLALSKYEHARLILWRMQRNFQQLATARPSRRRLHRDHILYLGRVRRRTQRTI